MPDLDPISRDLLIRTVIGEADDQPPVGQAAVAHVALNRLASGKYGATMPDVLFAKGQWEPWSTRANELINIPRNSTRYQRTAQIVDGVLAGNIEDPTRGMTHFLEPNIVMQRSGRLPDWASGRGLQIGSHVFYAPEGRVMPEEEDYISRYSSKSSKGAPSSPAPVEEEDLVSRMSSPKKAAAVAAAAPPPAIVGADTATSDRSYETLPQFINRITGESHGHGAQDLSGLVTGSPRGESWGDVATRAAAGIGRGIGDVGDTAAQGIAAGVGGTANFLAAHNFISPERAKAIADWRAGVNADIASENAAYEQSAPGAAGNLGRIGGEIAATAPILSAGAGALRAIPGVGTLADLAARNPIKASAVTGAGIGAGTNVLTSARSDEPLGWQALWGAGTGAALGPVGYGFSRALGRTVDPETSDLARKAMDKYGIPLRADQISSNDLIRRAGGLLQKTPLSGFNATVEQQQSAINRGVARTFGEDADKVTKGVWARAKDRIGSVFETELPKLEAHLNPNVSRGLKDVLDRADYLPPDSARVVYKHVDDVLRSFTGVSGKVGAPTTPTLGAKMSGKQIQGLIAKGSPLDKAIDSENSGVADLAGRLKGILLDAVGETATGRAKTARAYVQSLQNYQAARGQYKNLKTVQDLVEKSPTGDISPALLQGAVRRSFDNVASGGGGDLAELADIGQRFLKPPSSSGTAEHLLLMQGLGGALGYGGGKFADPEHAQDYALTGLIAPALGTRALGSAIASRMAARAALRSSLRGGTSAAGALNYTIPALAPRSNPTRITVHPDSPGLP